MDMSQILVFLICVAKVRTFPHNLYLICFSLFNF